MKNNFKINIAHLYPNLLNLYGDKGNILTLKNRLEWRNIDVETDEININDEIDFDKYDIYFICGGQDKQLEMANSDLKKYADNFKKIIDKGKTILAIDGGYRIFGKTFENNNFEKIDGLNVLNMTSVQTKKRHTGNVTIQPDFLTDDFIVGFENHTEETFLDEGLEPLGKIIIGHGNNSSNNEEGIHFVNFYGTYLHGALLPKNPTFTDYILQTAIRLKLNDNSYNLEKLDDKIEHVTHQNLIKKEY